MKKEDRELLLKDISARVPYNLQVTVKANIEFINTLYGVDIDGYCEVNDELYNIDNVNHTYFLFQV